ncbi:MAG: PKD domain-containing protein [Planctomycetes bacterium]|nr:PKD domain-containing protein [Planctomycetota bacterium]
MTRRSALAILFAVIISTSYSLAMDGIAISTHRRGGGDGLGANRNVYGDLVRHDIEDNMVVDRFIIYAGQARGARINDAGDKVVFLKLDGHLCVTDIEGMDFKELTNTKNRVTSAIDWPIGDWVYYSEEGSPTYKLDPPTKKTIRRVNVITGEDELVGMTQYPIWQLTLSSHATKKSGRFMVTSKLLNFANPQPWTNPAGLNCGSVLSPSGRYVSEMAHTHADLYIRSWDPESPRSARNMLKQFHVNEWQPAPNDGREYFYRPKWSVNSDKWIVMTHGADFACSTERNMVAYNWIDGQQIQITENKAGSGQNDEAEELWIDGVGSDFVPGGFEGEAPFAVNLTSKKLGGREWQWDFGDGMKKAAAEGTHTYTKPGSYRITAKLGEETLRQTVNVVPHQAPQGAVSVMDPTHLVVAFDEPMQTKDAKLSLTSGAAVESFKLGPLDRKLHVVLATPVGTKDTLLLDGVTDRAQTPNAVANPKLPVVPPAWPANLDGLAFLWKTNKAANVHFEPVSETFRATSLATKGSVRYDRNGTMILGGGVMCASNAGYGLIKRGKVSKELTIEAVITPDNAWQGHAANPSRIIVCRPDHYLNWDNGFFSLQQEGRKLVLYLNNNAQRFELCELAGQEPNHIVISVAPGRLACYLNGKEAMKTEKVKDLEWTKDPYCAGVHFGGFILVPGRHTPWRGMVEGVALFSRAVSAEDAAQDFAAYTKIMGSRKTVPQIELRARLVAKSKIPRPADIVPYRSALVVNEYDVIMVRFGKYTEKKVRVAEWGLLDTQPTQVAKAEIGSLADITLEAYTDHPELDGQVLRNTLDENFDLTLYVDSTVRAPEPPRLDHIDLKPREVWMLPGNKIQFSTVPYNHYGNPMKAKVKWSVVPGGSINVGTAYGAGHWFHEAKQPGKATITAEGLFEGTAAGTVKIIATAVDNPEIKGTAIVGLGAFPGVNPSSNFPLCIGADNGGSRQFKGDFDRIRIYKRMLTPEEIAEHAAGKGLETKDEDLVAEWTFDQLKNGAYPNVAGAGKGLVAKVVGEAQHVDEAGGGYVKLNGKGYLEVASDDRLDISKALTMECWIRSNGGGTLLTRQRVWMWGFYFGAQGNAIMLDGLRTDWGALGTGYEFPTDKWTHLVGILGPARVWQIYADGKLVKEFKSKPAMIHDGN